MTTFTLPEPTTLRAAHDILAWAVEHTPDMDPYLSIVTHPLRAVDEGPIREDDPTYTITVLALDMKEGNGPDGEACGHASAVLMDPIPGCEPPAFAYHADHPMRPAHRVTSDVHLRDDAIVSITLAFLG